MATDKYSFDTYWEAEAKKLRDGHYREWIITTMEHAARQAWNHSKAMANEEILEANVVINKGIWDAMCKNNRDKDEIQNSLEDK